MSAELTYTNPLTSTLAHFELELEETLERCEITYERMRAAPVEGLVGAAGKLRMLSNAISNIRENRNGPISNLQVWPSLGLLEARLWRSNGPRNLVIIHDPIPLRRQVGFDRLSRAWAPRGNRKTAPKVVVHSNDALREAARLLPNHEIVKALHPIRTFQSRSAKSIEPSVVVAGQYKPERNLQLLASIGPRLKSIGVVCSIYGRGWPADLPGWEVHEGFISDPELDQVLSQAWAVLLPYSLYFQSGIAIRALELGTHTVSPRTSFIMDLFGAESQTIAANDGIDEYFKAIKFTLNNANTGDTSFEDYQLRVDSSWRQILLNSGSERSA